MKVSMTRRCQICKKEIVASESNRIRSLKSTKLDQICKKEKFASESNCIRSLVAFSDIKVNLTRRCRSSLILLQKDQKLSGKVNKMCTMFCLVSFQSRMPRITKSDEFSEKFQTAFDPPPPHFQKVILRFSRQKL